MVRDTESGAALELKGVSLAIGANDILTDINWNVMPKERWALVGKNGAGATHHFHDNFPLTLTDYCYYYIFAGKTTLLKALTGSGEDKISLRAGQIGMAKYARMGYLEQKGVSGSTKTVREEVASHMERLQKATVALEEAEKRLEGGDISDEAIEALTDASTEFEMAGGLTADQQVSSVLSGLGFKDSDNDRKCSEFSGGWQMRIALARLLLSAPDLLILDEPTNHLDKGAREWLARYLAAFDGTLLVVSHDTALLEKAANSIAEVRAGKIDLYKSRSHEQWLKERDERIKSAQTQYEAAQREIQRLQDYIDRFGAKTMGAALAQSKMKEIEKIREKGPQKPIVSDGAAPVLRLPPAPRGTRLLLKMTDASLGWTVPGDPETGTPPRTKCILSHCDLLIERGMRIAVRGPNGAGKSTLLSTLSGKIAPLSGSREEGDGLALGVFTQDLAQDLDQTARAVDAVISMARVFNPDLTDEEARAAMGALGLVREKGLRLVGQLSGGEKARVALASFAMVPHNLLLMDEPSNHLDVGTIGTLTKALRSFQGTSLVISHDREFLEALEPTHVITVRNGRVEMQERSLTEKDWEDPI